jgi:nitrite reductase (NADH) small subunit
MHKKTFSLKGGKGISDEDYSISVYPVKVEGDGVFIGF